MRHNSLFIIHPYKYNGLWVFDDESVGLVREPFVAGMDTIFDILTANISQANAGFDLLFSQTPFPSCTTTLTWQREEMGGNIYRETTSALEGWLCPALFLYFPTTPTTIYLQIKGVPK